MLERPALSLSKGAGGEDQPAHPNAITPVGAHMFCPLLN